MSTEEKVEKFFTPFTIYIVDAYIIRARMNIFEKNIQRFGGKLASSINDKNITHIIVDEDLSNEKIRKLCPSTISDAKILLVRASWLVACTKVKKLLDTSPYVVELPKEEKEPSVKKKVPTKRTPIEEANDKIYNQTTDDEESTSTSGTFFDSSDDEDFPLKVLQFKNVPCIMFPHVSKISKPKFRTVVYSNPQSLKYLLHHYQKKPHIVREDPPKETDNTVSNHNKLITDKLQVLAEGYKSTNDRWRAISYEKAIQLLKLYPKQISSRKEVENLRGIGKRLAAKIWEIHESGELQKADEFSHNEKIQAMNLFTNIFGVGPTIAEQWYAQRFRTLRDLELHAKLTRQQCIGVKYYHEFLQRIPREEATQIVETVLAAVKEINPTLTCIAGGSYRRGYATLGDIDFILTHTDYRSHEGALPPLIKYLTEKGFLTDHLVDCDVEGNQKKYMGVCKVPGENTVHRRIDIICVPYEEYPTALIYFTGSVYFVRSMYLRAKRMGMRMNQHGLRGGVMRQGKEKLNDGYLIPTPTEESVFEKLGVAYLKPDEREHPVHS